MEKICLLTSPVLDPLDHAEWVKMLGIWKQNKNTIHPTSTRQRKKHTQKTTRQLRTKRLDIVAITSYIWSESVNF